MNPRKASLIALLSAAVAAPAWAAKPPPVAKAAPATAPASPSPSAAAAPEGPDEPLSGGLGRWQRNDAIRSMHKTFQFPTVDWKRGFQGEQATVASARAVAAALKDETPVETIARAVFILEMESPQEGRALHGKVARRLITRMGTKVDTGPEIASQVAFYHELYGVPCRGKTARQGSSWPPVYACSDAPMLPSPEPTPAIALARPPTLVAPLGDANPLDGAKPKSDVALGRERMSTLAARDRGDAELLRIENLASPPSQFCVKGRCFSSYAQVVSALFGQGADGLPVFCAPPRSADGKWDGARVDCSASWLDTLGQWRPWDAEGNANTGPAENQIPPYACIGSPHVIGKHMVLPAGGAAGQSGFQCRNRVFRVLAKSVEKNPGDVSKNISMMCAEMRMQVWGEKYPDINKRYQDWCRQSPERVKKGLCAPPGSAIVGAPDAPPLPFVLLSREELLFFYGHQELYCRADRKGLTHFLDAENHGKWAKSFTCNVPRGLLEAGPFEEGVQTCAIAPFVGEEAASAAVSAEQLKARLHCWKFNRPTCEELSSPKIAAEKDSLYRSNVFDVLDALREARRTRNVEAWRLFDMKDSEKLADYQDALSFADQGKDEGIFGVKEFCRFVGDTKHIQCGYDKKTIAAWYELHKEEPPAGCGGGVCARGAYQRGYFCSLHTSPELFSGKAYWMCGIDVGAAGRQLLSGARAICVGGERARRFLSAKGDQGSLQCYERRFHWGESERSEDLLRRFDWAKAVGAAAKHLPRIDPWIYGGEQLRAWVKGQVKPPAINPKNPAAAMKAVNAMIAELADLRDRPKLAQKAKKEAEARFKEDVLQDMRDLRKWASMYGHTLGHRTSLRHGLSRSDLPLMKHLREKMKFKATKDFKYRPYGSTCAKACKGKKCKNACVRLKFVGEGKEMALSKEQAKALRDLVKDVATGARSADGRWYQELRLAATEDGQLRIDPHELQIALRVHHSFEVLAGARRALLSSARLYADAIYAKAKTAEPLSRLELHERARASGVANRYKGNVFCVGDAEASARTGTPEYACGSSPLLVVGAVERRVADGTARVRNWKKRREAEREKYRQKIRSKVKFGWCYGGTEGFPLFGWSPSHALSEPEASSPFLMEIPKSVMGERRRNSRRLIKLRGEAPATPRTLRQLGWMATQDEALAAGLVSAPPKKGKAKGKSRPYYLRIQVSPLQETMSGANWMRCSGFTYSDEAWEFADPKREPKKAKPTSGKAMPAGTDPRAAEQTAKIMKEVGGLVVSIVKLVLPKFADAIQRVEDLAHAGVEFYDKYVKKYVDLAKKVWDAARGKLDAQQELMGKLKGTLETAMDEARKAAVEAAKPQASEEAMARVKGASADADAKVKSLRTDIKGAQADFDSMVTAAQKNQAIADTGELLGPLLEELIGMVTKRISGVIEPHARSLLSKGFKFVRNFLDPIAKSVISALAGIPFVGAGLAALGQVAYSLAMDALENAAGDALLGVVERLLAKVSRGVVTPVFKAVSKKILEIASGFCRTVMGAHSKACPKELKFAALPPKDRWLERALACGPRKIFDDSIYREAALAEAHVLRTAARMRRRVAVYARDLADHYLARFGMTYETWMAAVGGAPTPSLVARAEAMQRRLLREATERQEPAPAR